MCYLAYYRTGGYLRNQKAEALAQDAADYVGDALGVGSDPIGVILGTGWGDKLVLEYRGEVSFEEVPGFGKLGALEGHSRKFVAGRCGDKRVVALSGRVHLNEAPADPMVHQMVRLQTETLMCLGVKELIVTCAAGALPDTDIEVGNLVLINGFLTLFAPDMPLYAGEFCSPEDALTVRNSHITSSNYGGGMKKGTYAMVRGPFFEGRRCDKQALRQAGAHIVGMSTLPEACIAALYEAEVQALAFITNDSVETHDHSTNLKRAAEASKQLGFCLHQVIQAT